MLPGLWSQSRVCFCLFQTGKDEQVNVWSCVAGNLVDNLASGASAADLNALEDEEGNGFFGDNDFMGPDYPEEYAFIEGSLEVMQEIRSDEARIAEMRERGEDTSQWRSDVNSWTESGMSDQEVDSVQWLCFAGNQEYDWLVVNAETGRVFACLKDAPCMVLKARSTAEWLTEHAALVEKYRHPAGR